MMAGSITLGTYDTFNYFTVQAKKDLSQWLVEWRLGKSTVFLCGLGVSQRSLR